MDETEQELFHKARNNSLSHFIDDEDLREDLERVILIKKLITRLRTGKPNYRLILNHLVVLFNSFQPSFVTFILKSSIPEKDWIIANTFLVYMKRTLDIVNVKEELLKELKEKI